MADMISDLYVVLRAENELLLTGFREAATAGESMEAKLSTIIRTMDEQFVKLGESMKLVGTAADRMAVQVVAANERMAASAAQLDASMVTLASTETAAAAVSEAQVAASTSMVAANERLAESNVATGSTVESLMAEITLWADALLEPGIAAEELAITNRIAMDKIVADTNRAAFATQTMAAKNIAAMEAQDVAIDKTAANNIAGYAKITAGVALVGGAIIGITTNMAADFETATNKLYTSAGETKDGLDLVRQGLLDMTGAVGVGATQLASDMYLIESAGYHGAAGLGVLKAAEQGAKAEGADATHVADALSSALRDYYPHAKSAADVTSAATTVMSKFVGATSAGKMSFDQMAGALHSVLPVASAAGISLDDILGSLAAMTVHGYSAEQATQNLAHAIGHLQTVSDGQSKTFAILGFSAQQIAADLSTKGLTGVVKELSDAIQTHMGAESKRVILDLEDALRKLPPAVQDLGRQALDGTITWGAYTKAVKGLDVVSAGQAQSFATLAKSTHKIGQDTLEGSQIMQTYSQTLKSAMGTQTGMNVALMLGGENAEYAADAVKQVSGATADAQGNVKGWAEVQGTFNQKWSEFKASMGGALIMLGQQFLPTMTKVVDVLKDGADWLQKHPTAMKALAIAIGTLTAAAALATVAMWAFNIACYANPIGLIVAAAIIITVAATAALIAIFYQFRDIMSSLGDTWDKVWPPIKHFFTQLGGWISDAYHAVIDWFKSLPDKIGSALSGLGDMIQRNFEKALEFFKSLPEKAGNALSSLGKWIGDKAKAAWDGFLDFCKTGADKTVNFVKEIPYRIGYAIGLVGGIIARKAVDAWEGFINAAKNGQEKVTAFVKSIPEKVRTALGNAANWLKDHAKKAWDGFRDGCVNGFLVVTAWLATVPEKVKNFFVNAGTWIKDHAIRLWQGFRDGCVEAFLNVTAWFVALPEKIKNFFTDSGTWIKDHAKRMIQGFWDGCVEVWVSVSDWVVGLGPKIVNFFSNAGQWLYDSGSQMIHGLWNGIKAAGSWLMDQISGFAQGIIDGFKHGFEQRSPSRKMIVVGTYLMEGLAQGIDQNVNVALRSAKTASDRVLHSAAMGTPQVGAFKLAPGGMSLAARASSSSSQQVININVEGNIRTTQQFVKDVQREMLRFGIRNVGNGATYTGFGAA